MVNTIDLMFGETIVQFPVEFHSRIITVTEGLFHNNPFPAIFLGIQPAAHQMCRHHFVHKRWNGEIINQVSGNIQPGAQRVNVRFQSVKIFLYFIVDRLVIKQFEKFGQFIGIIGNSFRCKLCKLSSYFGAKCFFGLPVAARTYDCKFVRQEIIHKQMEYCRE